MTNDRLIILHAPATLEEAVVDCLLSMESACGFSSFPVNVHHHENKNLTLAEQVSGRKKQLCFQVYTDEAGAKVLLQRLKEEFSGSGIQFYSTAILENVLV